MSNAQHKDDLRSLWQSMPAPEITISADEMRARASKFQRKIRGRNMREYVAGGIVIAAFGWYATWPTPATPLWPIANLMIIAGALLVMWNLHRLARASALPPNASAASLADFQRTELARQRDALRTVWLWYIGPIVPGFALWLVAFWIGAPEAQRTTTWGMGLLGVAGLAAIVFAGIVILNLVAAARLQRLIDEIDSYRT